MLQSDTFDVKFNAKTSIRFAIEASKLLIEGSLPLPANSAHLNKEAILKDQQVFARAFALMLNNMESATNQAEIEKLKMEVAQFALWAKDKLEELEATN
jgi:hypothetical protein